MNSFLIGNQPDALVFATQTGRERETKKKALRMTKLAFGIAALGVGWGHPSWAADNGGVQPGSQAPTSVTATSASQPPDGQAPADVETAIQKAVTLPPGSKQLFAAFEAAMSAWVKQSPVQAFEWAWKQPKLDKRRHYVPGVAMTLWVGNDLQGAKAYVETPGNPGLGNFLVAWTDLDPTAAAAYAVKLPKEKWREAIPAVGEPWAGKDPKAASAWLSSLPVEQGSYSYPITAATWAWKDPAAAADWVGKLPSGEARNLAASMVAGVWGRKIPEQKEKAQEWAKGVTTPVTK